MGDDYFPTVNQSGTAGPKSFWVIYHARVERKITKKKKNITTTADGSEIRPTNW